MTLHTRVQSLIAASMLALVAVSLSVGPADAKPKNPVKAGACALPGHLVGEPEDWVFYVPGGIVFIKDSQGNEHAVECGADGKWTVIYIRTPVGRLGGLLPGGSVAQP